MSKSSRFVMSVLLMLVVVPFGVAQEAVAPSADAWRAEVAATYADLSAATPREQKYGPGSLSNEMLQDVWILHMNAFLARHPELTSEQRSVVLEGIGLAAAGFVRVMRTGTAEERAVMERSRIALEARAGSLLGRELTAAAFYRLGDPTALPDPSRTRMRVKTTSDLCTCSGSDCDWMNPVCSSMGGCIPTQTGCGFMGFYGCIGDCM